MDTRKVESNMRECTFNVLTPGRLYTITVTTRSWSLNASVSVEGRTGVLQQSKLSLLLLFYLKNVQVLCT